MISKAKTKLIRSLEQKKNRKALGLFVAEGPKVVADLMVIQQPVIIVAVSEWISKHSASIPHETEVYDVTDEELRKLSFLQHPQQVLAVFKTTSITHHPSPNTHHPSPNTQHPSPNTPSPNTLSLCLDGVQDPGNLGTIIRIADWFGIENIYCSTETADVWNPKVVQATMGSIARVRVYYCDLPTLLDSLPEGFPIYGTLLDGDDINQAQLENRGIIIMGNEGNGISQDIVRRVTHRLLIPNYPPGRPTADSLNVAIATAITAFAIRRN